MRKLIVSSILIAIGLCGAPSTAHAQFKLWIVDMNSVFTSYYKTQYAEGKINEARAGAKKELDERRETLKKSTR